MPLLSISLCHLANFFMSDFEASVKLFTGPVEIELQINNFRNVEHWQTLKIFPARVHFPLYTRSEIRTYYCTSHTFCEEESIHARDASPAGRVTVLLCCSEDTYRCEGEGTKKKVSAPFIG